MTAAEELRAEGIEIGKREGKFEGQITSKQQVLVRLLERKFGPLESAVKQKIGVCKDLNRLDRAIDLLLDVESIEEILKPIA